MRSGIETILSDEGLDVHDGRWFEKLKNVTADDVCRELGQSGGKFSLRRLMVLVSPAAGECPSEY